MTSQVLLTPLVQLPGGVFTMGTAPEQIDQLMADYTINHRDLFAAELPSHEVNLTAFALEVCPVTNAQFAAFLLNCPEWRPDQIASVHHNGDYLKHWQNGSYPEELAEHPVVFVTWYAAMAYAEWADRRLPTEAEWEYAARGGQADAVFPWGRAPASPERANYAASGIGHTTPVRSYPPNGYGLFDLAGNVWEYCLDEWQMYTATDCQHKNPVGGLSELIGSRYRSVTTRRAIRGGSWGGSPVNMRLAYRDSHPPHGAGPHVGFRCCL